MERQLWAANSHTGGLVRPHIGRTREMTDENIRVLKVVPGSRRLGNDIIAGTLFLAGDLPA